MGVDLKLNKPPNPVPDSPSLQSSIHSRHIPYSMPLSSPQPMTVPKPVSLLAPTYSPSRAVHRVADPPLLPHIYPRYHPSTAPTTLTASPAYQTSLALEPDIDAIQQTIV